jgi:tetratricopeptide (TPR) repeat protein
MSRTAYPAAVAAATLLALVTAGLRPLPAAADTITLTNGRVIEADRAWYEGSQLRYEKAGGVYGLPKGLVKSLEHRAPAEPTSDPDVLAARQRLAEGDAGEAQRLLKQALVREPLSIPALQGLAAAQLALGELRAARATADQAVRLDDRNPRSRALIGDVLAALGDWSGAQEQYRVSLRLRPDPEVQRKLVAVVPPEVAPATLLPAPPPIRPPDAQFRLRYDGGQNEVLGRGVQKALTDAYAEYAKRFGFVPEDAVSVVLQMAAPVPDGRVPDWADGWNDGAIKIPVMGLDQPTPRVLRVLRHELAHSFISSRTGNNCPTWLQEGVAQWLEGGDPNRDDAGLASMARAGRLPSLLSLEAPFRGLSESEATLAYAQSLSAVAHILRKRGEGGVFRLIAALGDKIPSEEAMPVALALSYPEFQRSWEDYLRTAEVKTPGGAGATSPSRRSSR